MQAQVLESSTGLRPLRAFLSFTTADKPLVEAFRDRLGQQHPDVELLDHGVEGGYEEDWKLACAMKIDRSEMLICLIGATTHRSEAVTWEINRGLSLGKRIVAFKLNADGVRVPEVLLRHAIEPRESIAGIVSSSAAAPALEREANGRFGR